MSRLTDAELDALKALADRATPGPWSVNHRHVLLTPEDDEEAGLGLEVEGPEEAWGRGQFHRSADARLIAASRTAVPALVADLQAARAALAAMTESSDRLLRERDQYMDRLGVLLPTLNARQIAILHRATIDERARAALLPERVLS